MEKTVNLQKFVLPFAFLAGLIRILIDFTPKIFSPTPLAYYSTFLIALVFEIVFIVYVIKLFKKKNSFLDFKQALKIGIIIMLILGLMYTTSAFIYDTYIDPDFQNNIALAWVQKMSPDQVETVKDQIELAKKNKDMNYFGIPLYTIWFVFLGAVISLISGNILKTKEIID